MTPEQRFDLHCKDATRPSNSHLHHAIAKYGRDTFEVRSIYESEDAHHTLEVMEPKFIAEYREAGKALYNIQPGGSGYKNNPRSKLVELYDSDLNLVETLPSMSAVARQLGSDVSTVLCACRNADKGKASMVKGFWLCFVGSKPVKKDTTYLSDRNRATKPLLGKKRPGHSEFMRKKWESKKASLADKITKDKDVDSSSY